MIPGFAAVRATPEECLEAGWKWVEIDLTAHPMRTFTRTRTDSLRILAEQYKAALSVHTAGLTLAEPVDSLRKAQLDYFKKLINFSADLGARFLVFHLGTYFCPKDNEQMFREAAKERAVEMVGEAVEYAKRKEVVLVVENSMKTGAEVRNMGEMMEEIEDFLNRFGKLKLCVDVGHANSGEGAAHYLTRFRERVAVVHLHDNDGVYDLHQLPGKGTVDWESVKRELAGFTGPGVLEVFSLGPECGTKDLNLF